MKYDGGLSVKTVLSFLLSFLLCLLLIFFTIINRSNVEKLTMEQLILEKSIAVTDKISKLLYKTYTLSSLVIQSNGEITEFNRVAATIVDDPAILNILIAPSGVVSNVYPMVGNESVIGLDFFSESEGNKEAILARDTGELVLGGPFNLRQGGQALVGRLPVYLDAPDGGKVFWGIVSVTLKYPNVLNSVGLSALETQGFAFEIWRIIPDTDEKQIIAASEYEYHKNVRYIERYMPIYNAEWYFRISPVRHWYQYPETWLLSFVGLLVSILIAYVTQNNISLKHLQSELKEMAHIDPLTGISNRRCFMEHAVMYANKAYRENKSFYIIIFDLDFFKQTNDKYGHLAGDEVLRVIAQRVKSSLRPYDLFARFGGEEFIVLVSSIEKTVLHNMIERIRCEIYETAIKFEGIEISVSASFGISQASLPQDLDAAINLADIALYKAKELGRNRIVFSDE